MGYKWPSEPPSEKKWPTPEPTSDPTTPPSGSPTGSPTGTPTTVVNDPPSGKWPTPPPSHEWPSKPPSDKWPSPQPTKPKTPCPTPSKNKDSWPSEMKEHSKDKKEHSKEREESSEAAINLLRSTLDETASIRKWSAHSMNGNDDDDDHYDDDNDDDDDDDDDDDKYKNALVVVWKPLDLLTFFQLIGILVVMLTFCFVLRGMCFGPRSERKGAKIVSDYDSDDLTDTEDELEKQPLGNL